MKVWTGTGLYGPGWQALVRGNRSVRPDWVGRRHLAPRMRPANGTPHALCRGPPS